MESISYHWWLQGGHDLSIVRNLFVDKSVLSATATTRGIHIIQEQGILISKYMKH